MKKKPSKDNPLSNLAYDGLRVLASDIRADIMSVCVSNGGHLSSNLGIVDLTISLLRNFSYQKNDILFDVGHQSYAYKILTGRDISSIRKTGGIAPFNDINESPYDRYSNGHAGDCIGTAIGMATAKQLSHDESYTIAIVGDASSENGLSYEALDYLSSHKDLTRLIIIINDNGMAISKNKGVFSKRFASLRNSRFYFRTSSFLGKHMSRHHFSWKIFLGLRNIKDHLKRMVLQQTFFEAMGLKYIGPYDGHDYQNMDLAFEKAKSISQRMPVVLHILTKKGYGYPLAEKDESGTYHGVSKNFDENDDRTSTPSFIQLKQDYLLKEMKKDNKLIVITPAMEKGSGLERVFKFYPERCLDVSIQEENAFLIASGLRLKGYRPIVDIYSTFLQRCYDEIIENHARMNLTGDVFVERCGLVGEDGSSHHGLYDVSFIKTIPNCAMYFPYDKKSFDQLMNSDRNDKLNFIRFTKEELPSQKNNFKLQYGYSLIQQENNKRVLLAIGPQGFHLTSKLDDSFDKIMLLSLLPEDELLKEMNLLSYDKIYLYDCYGTSEGTSSVIESYLLKNQYQGFYQAYTFKKSFITFGQSEDLLKQNHLDIEFMERALKGDNND